MASDVRQRPRVEGVVFDFFGTLVEIDRDVPTFGAYLSAAGHACPSWLERMFLPEAFNGMRTHPNRPSSDEYLRWRRQLLLQLALNCGASPTDAPDLVDTMLKSDREWTVRARNGALQLLDWLEAHQVRVGICSNWDYLLQPYLDQAGLPSPKVLVTSAATGARKPHADVFLKTAQQLGCAVGNILFVGDDLRCDIIGATHVGMRAIWITRSAAQESFNSQLWARSDLADVVDILENDVELQELEC